MRVNASLSSYFLAILLCALVGGMERSASAQTITRLTFNQGNDFAPAWDPRGVTIVYVRPKTPFGSIYDTYKVESSGQGGEQPFLTGLNTDFGVSVGLSWIGSTGFLAVEEAISGFEVLDFNTSLAPFNRTVTNGADAANALLLSINGGGGGGLTKISRDGKTALVRLSTNGSGGTVTIRSGAVSSMVGQLSSAFGTPLISVNVGGDPRYLNGGAISPDGSQAVIPVPIGSSTSGHDLIIGATSSPFQTSNLTNNASSGVLNVFPDFSPDGKKIAFARWSGKPDETYDLYVINSDGTGLTQLTNTPNFSESNPSWSPDGGNIAFVGTHIAGHEAEFPALQPGETANANIYILTLPAANTVTTKTQLPDPPVVTIDNRTATFIFTAFLKAQLKASKRAAARVRAKVTFKYDLRVAKDGAKRADNLQRTARRNSITIRNLAPGTYSAKYRVQITSKQRSKPPVIKNTKFSPAARFSIN